MRVLYVINSGVVGGLQMHVKCLMESLGGVVETAVVINTEIDPKVVSLFEDAGLKLYRLRGTSGHDWRVVGRFKKVLEDFKPDVVHAHGLPFLVAAWLQGMRTCRFLNKRPGGRFPILHSLHTLPQKPRGIGRLEWLVLDRLVDYYLPVSTSTWENFTKYHPRARGEVFFNPLRLSDFPPRNRTIEQSEQSNNFTIGMVGRNADVKDWPSFHKVEELVKRRWEDCLVEDCLIEDGKQSNIPSTQIKQSQIKQSNNQTILSVQFLNAGEHAVCDGRAAIAKMDLFVMTSKHEQLPTTVLECFAIGTPICGFIPAGGTTDILGFSKGPVRGAFIAERSCEKLADIVLDLMAHPEKRQALAEDGRQILENHFDAEKNCCGRLMEIYREHVK